MANINFLKTMEFLASSVENNEVTNVEKLALAIGELEDFPMTLDILENSQVSQTLQSIRRSKQITFFISDRIRSLIKCWRQLLNPDIKSVVANEIKSNMSKTPAVTNGYSNGYVKDHKIIRNDTLVNSNYHSSKNDEEPVADNFKYKKKSSDCEIDNMAIEIKTMNVMENKSRKNIFEEIEDEYKKYLSEETTKESKCNPSEEVIKEVKSNAPEEIIKESKCNQFEEIAIRSRNKYKSSKVFEKPLSKSESHNFQTGKLKVKSTKELLADFSNFIENDIKDKILMDKISQEEDEPISYFPSELQIKEMVQLSIFQKEKQRQKRLFEMKTLKRKRSESLSSVEPEVIVSNQTHCELLLQQFNDMCSHRPKVVLTQFVPWTNLKRGLLLFPPEIKKSWSEKKRLRNQEKITKPRPIETPLSLDVINNLLENFEVRAQQKQLLSDAIQQRKEETKTIDNTMSLVDMSLKLKLKIPKVPVIKLRRKKTRKKKKKKPKIKLIKPPKVKKPRKKPVRPVPPITNYLDDIPILPPLTDDLFLRTQPANVDVRTRIEFGEENVHKLAYGIIEGSNCTRHTQTSEIVQLTSMYSHTIEHQYLHIFPWVDLTYPTRSTFPSHSNELLQSMANIAEF